MPTIDPPSFWLEVRVVLALVAILWLPGVALLTLVDLRDRWPRINQAIITVGLSIACVPVILYGIGFWLPDLKLNAVSVGIFLFICAIYSYNPWRRVNFSPLWLTPLEWAFVLIVGLTVMTRLWVAHLHPIPAWTDSFHHTLIAELTVQSGRLPKDLDPYFAIPLAMYHLGLHGVVAWVVMLSGASSHVALQWTAQALNGLVGLGVYLVLTKHSGHQIGALLGAAIVGLFCHMPAYYVNWGRFTQIASQSILLIAWFVLLESVEPWTHVGTRGIEGREDNARSRPYSKRQQFGIGLVAAILIASIFLLHFRVAALFILLLVVTLPRSLWLAYRNHNFWPALGFLTFIGAMALVFVLPALWSAVETYIAFRQAAPLVDDPEIRAQANNSYYDFPFATIPVLVARTWLLILAAVCTLIGLWRHHWLAITMVLWTLLLVGLGNTYRLGIPMLNITNLGMILIMLYMPIGLIVGLAANELWGILLKRSNLSKVAYRRLSVLLVGAILINAGVAVTQRITEIEPARFLVTEDDLEAMRWIRENSKPDDRFGVNAEFWRPAALHGEDGGYWIPYFTQRETTAPPMLMFLASRSERMEMLENANAVLAFEDDPSAIDALIAGSVDYIYVGSPNVNGGSGLNPIEISQSSQVEVVFESNGVWIFRLLGGHHE